MQPTCLYRYFHSDGNLLYIGITQNQGMRSQQHFATSAWFGETASATFTHFATREEALSAERDAIKSELPKYNLVHHPRRETWKSHWDRIFDVSSGLRGQDSFHDSLIQWMLDNPWPSKATSS